MFQNQKKPENDEDVEIKKQLSKYESQLSTTEEKVDAGERKSSKTKQHWDTGQLGVFGRDGAVTCLLVCFLKYLMIFKDYLKNAQMRMCTEAGSHLRGRIQMSKERLNVTVSFQQAWDPQAWVAGAQEMSMALWK